MAARRKKARAAPAPAKRPEDEGFGTLAGQLRSVKKSLEKTRRAEDRARRSVETTRAAAPAERPRRKLTETELMAEAFEALGDGFAGTEKYDGRGYDASDVDVVRDEPAAPEPAPADDPEVTADDLLFFETVAGDVRSIDRGRAALREKEWTGVAWRTEAQLASLSAEDLKRLETTPAQRELLRRSRRAEVPVLTVRHWRRVEALAEVESFVSGCAIRGSRFARIIHGKGRQSVDEAVLKPAVVAWCEGAGAPWVKAWAPEIDQTGQFGSIVVELVRPDRSQNV